MLYDVAPVTAFQFRVAWFAPAETATPLGTGMLDRLNASTVVNEKPPLLAASQTGSSVPVFVNMPSRLPAIAYLTPSTLEASKSSPIVGMAVFVVQVLVTGS